MSFTSRAVDSWRGACAGSPYRPVAALRAQLRWRSSPWGRGCAPPGFSGKSPCLRSFRLSARVCFRGKRAEAVGNSTWRDPISSLAVHGGWLLGIGGCLRPLPHDLQTSVNNRGPAASPVSPPSCLFSRKSPDPLHTRLIRSGSPGCSPFLEVSGVTDQHPTLEVSHGSTHTRREEHVQG